MIWNAESAAIADRQHGVVTGAQLVAAGASRAAVHREVQAGRLVVVHPGVFRHASTPVTLALLEMAAVLAAGPAARSAASAAAAYGVFVAPLHPHVLVSIPRQPPLQEVVVHRSRRRWWEEVRTIDGILTTSPLLTLHDCAETLRPRSARRVHDGLIVNGHLTAGQIIENLPAYRGRHSVRLIKGIVETVPADAAGHDSTLETALARLIADAGLPEPEHHYHCRGRSQTYEVDFGWPQYGVMVEADGPIHKLPEQITFDRQRDADLQAAGNRVLRFDMHDIEGRPDHVTTCIAAALRSAHVRV